MLYQDKLDAVIKISMAIGLLQSVIKDYEDLQDELKLHEDDNNGEQKLIMCIQNDIHDIESTIYSLNGTSNAFTETYIEFLKLKYSQNKQYVADDIVDSVLTYFQTRK
jgi:hypothetical protein